MQRQKCDVRIQFDNWMLHKKFKDSIQLSNWMQYSEMHLLMVMFFLKLFLWSKILFMSYPRIIIRSETILPPPPNPAGGLTYTPRCTPFLKKGYPGVTRAGSHGMGWAEFVAWGASRGVGCAGSVARAGSVGRAGWVFGGVRRAASIVRSRPMCTHACPLSVPGMDKLSEAFSPTPS